MTEKTLQPLEQKDVAMYGDEVTAVRLPDGQIYVVVAHMCDALGIDTQGQTRRMQNHAVLSDGLTWVDVLSTQGGTAQRRRSRVLRTDLVPLWLTGIRVSVVKEEIRSKLEQLQRNAARILWDAFQTGELAIADDFQSLLKAADSDTVQAYLIAQAVVKLARQQIAIEAKVEDHGRRLIELESAIATDDAIVTQDQAMQISQGVKLLALTQGKKSGRNEFGATYGELYRRFGITSYKQAPAHKFTEIMKWLNEWFISISDDDWPF